MKKLKVYFLGSFLLTWGDSHFPITLKTDKSRALFAYLLIENDHPHRRAKLMDMFWGNSLDQPAHNSLRQSIHTIHGLSTDWKPSPFYLLASKSDIQLVPQPGVWVDAFELESGLAECEAHHPADTFLCDACLRRLMDVAALYHGDFLDGFFLHDTPLFDWWLTNKREGLHQVALKSFAWITTSLMWRNDRVRAVHFAQRGVELFPWCEPAHHRYMKALALAGERGKALRQFEVCRNILTMEAGIEPSAETRSLYERIKGDSLRMDELLADDLFTNLIE